MEIRKVQVTGGSSYVITLPKEWADRENIRKNDPLGLVMQADGTLLVTKNIGDVQVPLTKEFDVTAISHPPYLFRLLIGAYIAGFTTIKVTSRNRFGTFVRGVVRDFTRMTIGPEVVEETESSILLKDLLNPMEMPFDNTMKRMYVIVKNMHVDAITAVATKNGKLAEDVVARDNDVDRLHWLIARQMNLILRNAGLSRKMDIPASRVVNTYLISRIVERIGDHAALIAENAAQSSEQDLDTAIVRAIQNASARSMEIFDRSMVSFFSSDLEASHRNIEAIPGLVGACEKINTLSMKEDTATAITLHYVAESIRRTGEYSGDISETVINYLVEGAGG